MKRHRNYAVEEAALCVHVHKHSVRRWIKEGLPTIAGRGPTLILGVELQTFLEGRRKAAKRPCPPGHLYCFKCRAPRAPWEALADYRPMTGASGDLSALCGECGATMHRRVKEADLERLWANLHVTRPLASTHLSEPASPSLNVDS